MPQAVKIAGAVLALCLMAVIAGLLIEATFSPRPWNRQERREHAGAQEGQPQSASRQAPKAAQPLTDVRAAQSQHGATNGGQDGEPEQVKWTDAWQAGAAVATAVLTIVLAVVNLFQAAKLRESLRIARESAAAAERSVEIAGIGLENTARPLVYIDDWEVSFTNQEREGRSEVIYCHFIPWVANRGQSLTRNCTLKTSWAFMDGPLRSDFEFPDIWRPARPC